ncbi:hypothetical protein EVAR_57771_1 [Eumeta japonica]|uniref:Uncharacterized protein n=1 Tax=Eumeta variegata TaxID=151549 RepID=A0A4C1Y6M4_EUMVA|nr:hypothetical protein EVAR_57771_1 [Eumeta japonica]
MDTRFLRDVWRAVIAVLGSRRRTPRVPDAAAYKLSGCFLNGFYDENRGAIVGLRGRTARALSGRLSAIVQKRAGTYAKDPVGGPSAPPAPARSDYSRRIPIRYTDRTLRVLESLSRVRITLYTLGGYRSCSALKDIAGTTASVTTAGRRPRPACADSEPMSPSNPTQTRIDRIPCTIFEKSVAPLTRAPRTRGALIERVYGGRRPPRRAVHQG